MSLGVPTSSGKESCIAGFVLIGAGAFMGSDIVELLGTSTFAWVEPDSPSIPFKKCVDLVGSVGDAYSGGLLGLAIKNPLRIESR